MDDREDKLGSPLPARILEEFASRWRTAAGVGDEPPFDVSKAIWRLAKLAGPTHGLHIVPRPDEQMGDKEAWASALPPTITIRESRFVKPDCPDTRFILSHELFHVLLHPEGQSFRVVGGNAKPVFLSKDDLLAIYHDDMSHEVQADVAARAFLMPANQVFKSASASDLARNCNVPLREAQLRYAQIRTAKKCPKEVKAFLESRRNEDKRLLWSRLPVIPGKDPDQSRKVGPYRIDWDEFGLMTDCGWTIENGSIVSYFDMRAGRLGR
jgi:hypothetical protein